MSRVSTFLVAVALSTGSSPAPPAQTPARATPVAAGTAIIRGRAVDSSGQPVRNVRVRVSSTALSGGRSARTDVDGRYEIKALPAGRYTLSADKPSYVPGVYGQTAPSERGKPIELADGQILEQIDFKLGRAGVVTGKVVDEFGEPMTDVQVSLMRYAFGQGARQLVTPGGGRSTNDIGEFRIFGVLPGQYYLAATLRTFSPGDSSDRSAYAATYYPGTASVAEAQLLTIAADQTLAGMNFSLLPTRSARVSGTAVDAMGRPLTNAFVSATPRMGTGVMGGYTTQVKPDGTFSIGGLSPGDYVLRVNGGGDWAAALPLTIGSSDLNDVQLIGVKPSSVSGRVIVDRAATDQLKPSDVRIWAFAARPDDAQLAGGLPARVNDDFTFELMARAGRVLIRPINSSPEWTVKAVRVNGADVTDSGVDIAPNQPLSGVEVEVTNHHSELSGIVTDASGEPTRNAWIVVFAQDRQKWAPPSRFIVAGRPDLNNQFRLRMPPGAYCAIALDRVEPGEWTDLDFLERIRGGAVTFSIGEGEKKTLDLKLVSTPGF